MLNVCDTKKADPIENTGTACVLAGFDPAPLMLFLKINLKCAHLKIRQHKIN